jgi:hypothetical protein
MKMKRLTILVALMAMASGLAQADLSALKVYPNPARPSQGDAEIVFEGIPGGDVKIYNANGTLVREFSVDGTVGTFRWDLKNDSGREVASGIYLYRISSGDNETTGKLGIIR